MMDELAQSRLRMIRSNAEHLMEDGYCNQRSGVATRACFDVRFLLSVLDGRETLDPHGCQKQVAQWVEAKKYRTVMHRHTGLFRAIDESEALWIEADTLPLLADELMNWPRGAKKLPFPKWVKVNEQP